MDDIESLFSKIEQAFTNIGTDQIWKKKVGNHILWFSPIDVPGQEKLNNSLTNSDLGSNILIESKRIALSFAIVGIDDLDFSKYRHKPIFPVEDIDKDGKQKKIKVTPDVFIYKKIKTWSGQYLDDAFSVYADLNERHQKENLKDVVFENVKDPEVELMELEARVVELREKLGKTQLVAKSVDESDEEKLEDESNNETSSDESELVELTEKTFNPFKQVQPEPVAPPVVPVQPPKLNRVVKPEIDISAEKLKSLEEKRAGMNGDGDLFIQKTESSVTNPHVPRVNDEVIESKSAILNGPQQIVVDRLPNQGVNPRFARRQ